MRYYDEKEYFQALRIYEEAEAEADLVAAEVFSTKIGEMPSRSITDEDMAVFKKKDEAWEKFLEIARRPARP